MKVSDLKEGMFIIVDESYNYGSLGKYLSHTIEEDEDGEIWCCVKFGMFIEVDEGRFRRTYKEYTMNFFCYEEDDEYGAAAGDETFDYVADDGSLDDGFITRDIDDDSEFYADKDDDDFDIDFPEGDDAEGFDDEE